MRREFGLMPGHTKWSDYKQRRGMTVESSAAYQQSRHAYELGRRLRELREARGLSQAELARRIGTTAAMVDRLELGGADPRMELLQRLSSALDADLVIDVRPRDQVGAPA
jgi:ribosome-binding protein aMBF1 (putative translation factor)